VLKCLSTIWDPSLSALEKAAPAMSHTLRSENRSGSDDYIIVPDAQGQWEIRYNGAKITSRSDRNDAIRDAVVAAQAWVKEGLSSKVCATDSGGQKYTVWHSGLDGYSAGK
jgi:hypothetical protein